MHAVKTSPARFDEGAKERRLLIAKIHLAKKEMGLVDDDYRAILIRIAGRTSSKDCTIADLRAIVEELKRLGFQPRPARGRSGGRASPKPADHPTARKARALWISLHQLGAIDNPSEQALEAFARRQLGVERLQWANQSLAYKLIEALKAIGSRHGWDQDAGPIAGARTVRVLKLRLCRAILAKLVDRGLAAADWTLGEAAFRLLGMGGDGRPEPSFWEQGDIDLLAQGLGRKLRGEA